MYRKQIAIYVEGQTEQIFLNHLILTWWKYTEVEIKNIKLQAYQNSVCKVHNFPNPEALFFFLIIDVDGVGSLLSAMADRAKQQLQNGFEIIGLRDLCDEDYERACLIHKTDPIMIITNRIKEALERRGYDYPEQLDVFFAIMEIEAWLLAFTLAVSKWGRISEEGVLKIIKRELGPSHLSLEAIKRPSTLIKKIGEKGCKANPKSLDEVKSLVSSITREEIQNVYESHQNPSFRKFWDKLVKLESSLLQEL